MRFETGGAEFARDELGGFVVFRRCGEMRLGGEGLQIFAGKFGVGNSKELFFELRFGAEVGKAEGALRHDLRWRWARREPNGHGKGNKRKCRTESH